MRTPILATLQTKCEAIEEAIQSIEMKLKTLLADKHHSQTTNGSHDTNYSVFSTQKYRSRLQQLVASPNLNGQQTQESTISTHEDLSTYPVISELLAVRPSLNINSINGLHNHRRSLIEEIYISRFPTTTTCEDIEHYIAQRITVDRETLKIHRLTKKHQDITELTFLSFKIETSKTIASSLLKNVFWPTHVVVKSWKRKCALFPPLSDRLMNPFLERKEPENRTT